MLFHGDTIQAFNFNRKQNSEKIIHWFKKGSKMPKYKCSYQNSYLTYFTTGNFAMEVMNNPQSLYN